MLEKKKLWSTLWPRHKPPLTVIPTYLTGVPHECEEGGNVDILWVCWKEKLPVFALYIWNLWHLTLSQSAFQDKWFRLNVNMLWGSTHQLWLIYLRAVNWCWQYSKASIKDDALIARSVKNTTILQECCQQPQNNL